MHLFFMVLALVFWNPLSFYFIYSDTAVYGLKLIHFLFWLAFAGAVIILCFFSVNKIGNRLSNMLLFIDIAGIAFALIVMTDKALGMGIRTEKAKILTTGLLFEPRSKIKFQTVEFDYVAEINAMGLRDREIGADKAGNYRVLCVGDSWTFGWGVNIEESWPKKLELFLKRRGIKHIEVINCGQPGRYSTTYRTNMEKLLPALKPDLVLLGVLQLDDLAQLHEEKFPPRERIKEKIPTSRKIAYAIKTFLSGSIKNMLAVTKNEKPAKINLKASWINSVATMISNFSPAQQLRYDMLDDAVKNMLRSGDLTPGYLYYIINHPDRVSTFNNPAHPATQFAVAEMNKDIGAIKGLCNKNNAGLIFLNLPVHYFTGHKVVAGADDSLYTFFERNNKIDSLYRSVALKNAVPYFELTNAFRSLEDRSGYFFRYDGHPNKRGYEKIAELVGQYLIDSNKVK